MHADCILNRLYYAALGQGSATPKPLRRLKKESAIPLRQPCDNSISTDERLAVEWHEDKPSPDAVSLGSSHKYKWRCGDAVCGHVWEARPSSPRGPYGSNCRMCALKEWRDRGRVSLAKKRPDMIAEWDTSKNTLPATGISYGSSKKAWWLCQVCGKSWQAIVTSRVRQMAKCRACRQGIQRG